MSWEEAQKNHADSRLASKCGLMCLTMDTGRTKDQGCLFGFSYWLRLRKRCIIRRVLFCGLQGIFLSKVNDVGPSCKAGLRPGDKLLMVWIVSDILTFYLILLSYITKLAQLD